MPRILVADDNTNIQKMVALAFEERGIDVVSVGNGEAAVRRLPDLRPDLVLADVFMPVRNGYEVCEFVKRDERFSHVPVILLVGAFDPLDEKEARRVGADGVLKKPFVPPDPLIAMVTAALEKNPRIAAEMAKAREVPVAPPSPEPPAPLMETPARLEPKPLPEFPEPSPEETEAMYGFAKGRGRLDDDEAAEAEQDFDGSSTTHDWRRNAGNFEVPEGIGSNIAFVPDAELNPVTFSPEAELSSQDASAKIPAQELEPVEQNLIPVQASDTLEPPRAALTQTEAAPEERVVSEQPAATVEPEPVNGSRQPEKSKLRNWMDSIASPSEYAEGGWMSSIFGNRSKNKAQKHEDAASAPVEEPVAAPVASTDAAAVEPARVGPASAEIANIERVQAEHAHVETVQVESAKIEPAQSVQHAAEVQEETLPQERRPVRDSWLSPPPPPVMRSHSEPYPFVSPEPARFSISSQPADDLVAAPPEPAVFLKDPELELPAAPHVTPEPLLVEDDEPTGASAFSSASEQLQPLHSFLPPVPVEVPADESANDDAAMPQPFEESVFAPSESAHVMNRGDERIPSVPPPNRDALSDIPFLTPRLETGSAQASPSVDDVVAKVLQKLEPQLHDLLSQGVLKPLVENLLQQELKKTER